MLFRAFCFLTTILLAGTSLSDTAQDLSVRGGLSGYWHAESHPQQTLQIEVIDSRSAAVSWLTYDDAGEPVWLAGFGDVRGDTVTATLSRFSGGRFPTASGTGSASLDIVGRLDIAFSDCHTAELQWQTIDSGYPAGNLTMTRLTDGIEGVRCGAPEEFQRTVHFSFEQGAGPWMSLFTDYTEATQDSIDTESGWTSLPQPLQDRNGFGLAGTNAPDDLAMYMKAPLDGLQPDTEYRVELAMTFATQEPQNCLGIGGSPGGSVGVKLGASGTEPVTVENDGSFRMNIDKGGPADSGEDTVLVGDMSNFQEECLPIDEEIWQLKDVSTRGETFRATTNADGRLWVYGGSDSGFEGRTTFFVTDFTVRLAPVSP